MDIIKLIQPHLLNIQPYSTARDEYEGTKGIFLDANENSIGSVHEQQFNRYPDPHHLELKQALSKAKNISVDKIFVGNGSDEAIDLLIRLFCRPGIDSIIVCPPTYGMYAVSAAIHDIKVKEAILTDDFQLNLALIEALTDQTVKMIFLCSPNNPTGNLLKYSDVEMLLDNFQGIVVIDEAYIDFAKSKSWLTSLHEYPNLVVLQTFSKAWGLAALRIGMCFASSLVTYYLEKIKPPYNLNGYSQKAAIEALKHENLKNKYVQMLIDERERMKTELKKFPFIKKIFPSDSNFLLIRTSDAQTLFNYLIQNGIIVRNRSSLPLCQHTLRITIGTFKENNILLDVLSRFGK